MAFEVIPALDVAGGRLVRIDATGSAPVDAFDGDPVAAAEAFVRVGARRLHLVDVELAATGTPANLETLRDVAGLGVPVQASGGARSAAHVEAFLSAGADRVVLGSGALAARRAAEELIAAYGDRLCVGIEADGSTIRPRGGGEALRMWDTLVWLGGLDVRRYVFTELSRVGRLSGPDLDGIWALATHTERPVVAAGGIGSMEDLRAIAALGGFVEGAVVGRALHEGLDLAEALQVSA
jgi:phosphoribosylformimino-5-aminoimidazole carboxamide ribonucleotide (ProFAR) isomerase